MNVFFFKQTLDWLVKLIGLNMNNLYTVYTFHIWITTVKSAKAYWTFSN